MVFFKVFQNGRPNFRSSLIHGKKYVSEPWDETIDTYQVMEGNNGW